MNPVVIGTLSAAGSAFFFSLNDVMIKLLSGDYALHQLVLIRSSIAVLLIIGIMMPLAGGFVILRTRHWRIHLVRGTLVFGANMMFMTALAAMPIAEAVAVFFVTPLMTTLFSVIFLRETVGPRRWLAVAIGFAGVLVILRPGTAAFQPAALLVLGAALCYSGMNTLTRKVGRSERAETLAVYNQLFFVGACMLMGFALGDGRFDGRVAPPFDFLFRPWLWPALGDWPLMLISGVATALGGYLVSQAYRHCESALVAPFEYVGMPMALFWGVAVFGEWPDAVSLGGIALIMSGGLYMMYRETRNMRGPA